MSQNPGKSSSNQRGPWLWPLALAVIGLVLLLNNFLLLGDFNAANLWPLLLVILGAQVLLRGDLRPYEGSKTFGITRGSVESATLEVKSGSVDVGLRALRKANQTRLIAGQYAIQSRPELQVQDVHTYLKMDRAQTPWFSMTDWELGLARDLPWQLLISTHLGALNLDLSELIVQDAVIATGIGDIHLICPQEAFGPIQVHSSLGSIQVITPPENRATITVKEGRFFGVHVDETRYQEIEPGVFVSYHDSDNDETPLVQIEVSGVFGDVYLA